MGDSVTLFQDYHAQAESIIIPKGTTLFSAGDNAEFAYLCLKGQCILSKDAVAVGQASSDEILDVHAVLGGLPHSLRAITTSDCDFLRWRMADLWHDADFSQSTRRYLAEAWHSAQSRLDDLQAPIHYQPYSAELVPPPFVFPTTQILFAFCEADISHLTLPEGVQRIGKGLLVAIAYFKNAYYEYQAQARFSYSETTFFLPVRVGAKLGLYVPFIYPSTYEAILLGREIYGFPKRLGLTTLSETSASLAVDSEMLFTMRYTQGETCDEGRIVGSFGRLFGVPNGLTSTAFRIGDNLLTALAVPFYRRVNVFNHKKIPAADTRHDAPRYAVNQLTQAIFSVESWSTIRALSQVELTNRGLTNWQIRLREAYLTSLSMRLSTGRILRDYLIN